MGQFRTATGGVPEEIDRDLSSPASPSRFRVFALSATRKRVPRRVLSVSLIVTLSLGTAGGARSSPLTRLRDKWNEISRRIQGQQRQIEHTAKVKQNVTEELAETRVKLAKVEGQLAASRTRLAAAQAAVAEAQRRLGEAQARLKLQQGRFGRRIAANYTQGPVTYTDVLLGARDLSDFLDREYYVDRIMRQDAVVLNELRAARLQVASEHALVLRRQQEVAAAHLQIARQEQALEAEKNKQRQLLHKVNSQLEDELEDLEEMERDSREVERALRAEEARRRIRRRTDPTYRDLPPVRGFRFPILGGHIGQRDFGVKMHPIYHTWRMHSGVDIPAGMGVPIYAAAAGEVFLVHRVSPGLKRGYGNYIIVLHRGGISTRYAHCSRIIVRPGQQVRQGQVIGYVGSTGGSTAPHLHFEVLQNGTPRNPRRWLP